MEEDHDFNLEKSNNCFIPNIKVKLSGINIKMDDHIIFEEQSIQTEENLNDLAEESATNADDLEDQEHITPIQDPATGGNQLDESNKENGTNIDIIIDDEEMVTNENERN